MLLNVSLMCTWMRECVYTYMYVHTHFYIQTCSDVHIHNVGLLSTFRFTVATAVIRKGKIQTQTSCFFPFPPFLNRLFFGLESTLMKRSRGEIRISGANPEPLRSGSGFTLRFVCLLGWFVLFFIRKSFPPHPTPFFPPL